MTQAGVGGNVSLALAGFVAESDLVPVNIKSCKIPHLVGPILWFILHHASLCFYSPANSDPDIENSYLVFSD